MPKNSRKKQNYYKMKGCSKNAKHLGGSSNLVLAYPSKNINTLPNPALAYTGKGGACTNGFTSLSYKPPNIDGVNPTQPSSGPSAGGYNFLNPQVQRGGGCGCGLNMTGGGVSSIMKGGSCSSCVSSFLKGGAGSHRVGCKCSACKNKMTGGKKHSLGCSCNTCKMKGGSGNNGIPYPNGLVGSAWTPSVGGWPGVKGIGGDNSYLGHNNYNTDISRYMINTNANRPFSIGGGKKKLNKTLKNRKQKGGSFSNFLAQDLINVGRQIQYGLGSAYNGIAGYPQSPSPMPWKGQFQYNSDNTVTIPKKY